MDRKELVELKQRLELYVRRATAEQVPDGNLIVSVNVVGSTGARLRGRDGLLLRIHCLGLILEESTHGQLTLADVAEVLCRERSSFCRLFPKLTGRSFSDWYKALRIRKARMLLRRENGSILNISLAAGYRDIGTFERHFKEATGMTPSSFRRSSAAAETFSRPPHLPAESVSDL